MTDPVNEEEFQGANLAKNMQIAMGQKRDSKMRMGGIASPEKNKYGPGMVLFRFGNKARDRDGDKRGPWWVSDETLVQNARLASDAESLIGILRQHLALPNAFSPLDRVFQVALVQRIAVFEGVGNGIFRRQFKREKQAGLLPLYLGGIETDGSPVSKTLRWQIYIPGLAKSARDAMAFKRETTAAQWLADFKAGR